jgi:hypothetical protein
MIKMPMEIKNQTIVRIKVISVNGYCPIFKEDDLIFVKKHCLDLEKNELNKFCYHTITDLYPAVERIRKMPEGSKEIFRCRDNGIIEFELERMNDEEYDYERH